MPVTAWNGRLRTFARNRLTLVALFAGPCDAHRCAGGFMFEVYHRFK